MVTGCCLESIHGSGLAPPRIIESIVACSSGDWGQVESW